MSSLAQLADRPAFRLSLLDPWAPDAGSMADLLALAAQVPRGLIHAEAIWLLPSPPALEPLAEGSSWYAIERSLALVTDSVEQSLQVLLRYRTMVRWVISRLRGEADLASALAADVVPATVAPKLAERLGLSFVDVTALDHRAPGLRHDMAWMLQRDFDPEVRTHPRLRPSILKEEGAAQAGLLLLQRPGRFDLLICDHPLAVEPLSPYVADVGSALYQWAHENPEAVRVAGLGSALENTQETPDRSWASMIATLIADVSPQTLVERRQVEAQQGLELYDGPLLTTGWCDLATAVAPDESVVQGAQTGQLVLVIGPPEAALGAAQVLLASSRVERFAAVFGGRQVGAGVAVVESVALEHDGLRLPESSILTTAAADLEVASHRLARAEIGVHLDSAVGRILGEHRRAWVDGQLNEDSPCFLTLYEDYGSVSDRDQLKTILDAMRVSLASLVAPRYRPTNSSKGEPRKGNPMRARFRA